jgi:membrane protein
MQLASSSKRLWQILKKSTRSFFQEDVFTYSASISFYTMLSLPAVLLIAVSVAATFYQENRIEEELIAQISDLIGIDTAKQIERILAKAALKEESAFLAKVVGIGTLIISSTTVFFSLQTAINKIWNLEARPGKSWIKYLLKRLLSLAMVISIGFLLMVSLIIESILMIFKRNLQAFLGDVSSILVQIGTELISFGIVWLIFSLMFKVLPDASIRWKNVWIGGLITTFLFVVGKFLIGLYLGSGSMMDLYGASGSLVVILVWTYYASLIFLLGSKITQTYTQETEGKPLVYDNAIEVETIKIEKGT